MKAVGEDPNATDLIASGFAYAGFALMRQVIFNGQSPCNTAGIQTFPERR